MISNIPKSKLYITSRSSKQVDRGLNSDKLINRGLESDRHINELESY